MPFMDTEAGAPSTPASDPGMFPTIGADGIMKPSSASVGLGEGFMRDISQAFHFGSALNKAAPDVGAAKAQEGDLSFDPFKPTSKDFGAFGDDKLKQDTGTTPGKNMLALFRGEARETTASISPDHDVAKVAYTAAANDVNPKALSKIAQIESGGNANAVTGSYKGLFQLSDREFQKHNPGGNIFNAADNTLAATRKIATEAKQFETKYGRAPTVLDTYMIHQQGEGGYANHMKNPDAPAWQNMAATGEGKAKGEAWAKQAIWGNIPTKYKAMFGSVNDVTSRDFMNIWANRLGPEASQPIIKRDVNKDPQLLDAGTPAHKMQLAGGVLDTVLKPFGYRTKTQAEIDHESMLDELSRTTQQGEENFPDEREQSGIGDMQSGRLKSQGLDAAGNPIIRRMGA